MFLFICAKKHRTVRAEINETGDPHWVERNGVERMWGLN